MKQLLENWKGFLNEQSENVVVAIFGPSGCGKTTQKNIFIRYGWQPIVSYTTRQPREGEKHGLDYNFISREEFEDMEASETPMLMNINEYADQKYGVRISDFESPGKKVIITDETSIESLSNAAGMFGKRFVLIYCSPPVTTSEEGETKINHTELIKRHRSRRQHGEYESDKEMQRRIGIAQAESEALLNTFERYQGNKYIVDDLEKAAELAQQL